MKRYASQGNRGKALELLIIRTNELYRARKIGNIQKIATPVKVRRVDNNGRIRDGWFDEKSTVDFKGVFKSRYLSFDAKSTRSKTSFKLSEIKSHQYQDLKIDHECGGIAFVIVEFVAHHTFFLLPFLLIKEYKERSNQGGRKSIPYDDFKNRMKEIPFNRNGLDYLNTIEEVINDEA